MDEEKLRNKIDSRYKWDLTKIYKNKEEFYQDCLALEKEFPKILDYENKVMDSADNLYNLLSLYFGLKERLGKISTYGNLSCDVEVSNQDYQAIKGKAYNVLQLFNEQTSFIEPEILEFNARIEDYKKQNLKLKEFDIYLKGVVRLRDYTPDKKTENVISNLSSNMSKTYNTYQLIINSEMEYERVSIEGVKVKANVANLLKYSKHPNQKVRKKIYQAYFKSLAKHNKSLSSNYEIRVSLNNQIAKLKGYNSALEQKLIETDVDITLFDNLISTITNNISLIEKYYDIRKRQLNLKKLHYYDIYDIFLPDKKYKYDDGIKIIKETFKIFGEDYINLLNEIIDNGSIDVYPNKDKIMGGYNWRWYGKPFIFYNYRDEFGNMFGIAHELGHAVNSIKSQKANSYQNFFTSSLISEVASLTNEIIMANILSKKSSDKTEKLIIMQRIIDLFLMNVFGAVRNAEFERDIHDLETSGETLTADKINEIYNSLNKKYNGNNLIIDEECKYGWMRILHLYYGYYNWQYAIGLLSAVKIANDILNEKPNALKNYLSFLELGGTKTPEEALKVIGIDINKSDFINESLNYFSDLLEEYETICLTMIK